MRASVSNARSILSKSELLKMYRRERHTFTRRDRVTRFIWQFSCFGVVLVLALVGRSELNTYLVDFLSLLGYWCTSYVIIVLTEHTFIRNRNFANHNLAAWNDPAGLPHGVAA